MTDAQTIVRRLIVAKKYPNAGRYLFEEHELVALVEAVQGDAQLPGLADADAKLVSEFAGILHSASATPQGRTNDDVVGVHERCSQSTDREEGSELKLRSMAGEWAHLECSACALEVSLRLWWLFAAASKAATTRR